MLVTNEEVVTTQDGAKQRSDANGQARGRDYMGVEMMHQEYCTRD